MKVYEKLGINPATKEGMKALLEFTCGDIPVEYKSGCKDGSIYCGECKYNYLMSEIKEREIDWTKVPKDTPVLVWDHEKDRRHKRYFESFQPGCDKPFYCFNDGKTSWSSCDATCRWKFCKLAFPEQAKDEWYKNA